MAHFEKVRISSMSTGVHNCLPARLRVAAYGSGSGQSRASMGAWPVAFDAGPSQTPPRHREQRRRRCWGVGLAGL